MNDSRIIICNNLLRGISTIRIRIFLPEVAVHAVSEIQEMKADEFEHREDAAKLSAEFGPPNDGSIELA